MADSPFALRLSHAGSWVKCAAFTRMQRTPQAVALEDEDDHTIREEGTAMHWVAQCEADGLPVMHGVGSVAPNGVVITDELYDGAMYYVDVLRSYGTGWVIEATLPAPMIHPECGGTPDAFKADPGVLRIADLKGGFRPVEVFPNWQLFGYLAAILSEIGADERDLNYEVEFTIVQPRAYHRDGPTRTQRMIIRDCLPYIDSLRMAAALAMGDVAPAVAGNQCDDCAARASCSVCHAAGMRALEVAGEPDVHDLPMEAIDYEMQRIEDAQRLLTARLTGLQAQASRMIRNGAVFPHYALERGTGRLNWIDDDAMQRAIMTGDMMGVDLRKPSVAITPTQAAKKLPADLIDGYARRNPGEVKLVRFDRNAAVKAFSHLKLEN